MDTLMMMSVNVSDMADIPKSLVIPSSNLKLNETVGQGTYFYINVHVQNLRSATK